MKKNLFSDGARFYKVNLHCHTTLSDGTVTPEETKEIYKSLGYDAVAFTDHRWTFDVSYLNDDDFLAIRAYEYDIQDAHKRIYKDYVSPFHTIHVHMNFFPKDPKNNKVVCMSPEKVPTQFADKLDKLDELGIDIVGGATFKSEFTIDCLNKIIKTAKENGYIVVLNHPNWSINDYSIYSNLKGLDGLEMINGAMHYDAHMNYVPHVYEEMERAGMRLIITAGDDNHHKFEIGHAWTMVKANELTQEAIIENVANGNCYVSEGPDINELYLDDDGYIVIRTSKAKGIYMNTIGRRAAHALALNDGEYVTEGRFKVLAEDGFVRFTVVDERGKHAATRAFHMDELGL